AGGAWQGPGSTCGTANCGQPLVSGGDNNRDGIIDEQDVLNVLLAWTRKGTARRTNALEDANGDGAVDLEDLQLVIDDWGR
ncbi:MAG: hypothetical protein ACYTGC_12800, partial [Planctomycetota bacterium]